MLADARFFCERSGMDNGQFYFDGISWAGQDYIAAVRDPNVWRKTKTGAEAVGSWTIEIVNSLAVGYAKQKAAQLGSPI